MSIGTLTEKAGLSDSAATKYEMRAVAKYARTPYPLLRADD